MRSIENISSDQQQLSSALIRFLPMIVSNCFRSIKTKASRPTARSIHGWSPSPDIGFWNFYQRTQRQTQWENWGWVKANTGNWSFDSIACPQSDVNSEIDPAIRVWCYQLYDSNSKEQKGIKIPPICKSCSVHVMRTQLTEFPLCAEWTFDEEGLEGEELAS